MLGVFALVGMIIRNSVVLMAQIKENEDAGMERGAAIVDATMHRLRPILLTAAAAILGLIPIVERSVLGTDGHRHDGRAVHRDRADADLPAGAVCELVSRAEAAGRSGGLTQPSKALRGGWAGTLATAGIPATVSITVRYCSARLTQRKRSTRARSGVTSPNHESSRARCSMPSTSLGSTHTPAPLSASSSNSAALARREAEDGPAGGHVVVHLVRRGIEHVVADHREQHVRALQFAEQRGEWDARPHFDEAFEAAVANALQFGARQVRRSVVTRIGRCGCRARKSLQPRAAPAPANGR